MTQNLPVRRNGHAAVKHSPVAGFALAALAMLLVACGFTDRVDYLRREDISPTAAAQAVVVGRLHIRSTDGLSLVPEHPWRSKERQRDYRFPSFGFYTHLMRVSPDAGGYDVGVRADGRFIWRLEPGIYVIERVYGLSLRPWFDGFCPKAVFRVARPTGIVNLGEITIEFDGDSSQQDQSLEFEQNLCHAPNIPITVTQEAGDFTGFVLHPLTRVVVAPQLPQLWTLLEYNTINHNNLPSALAVLRELGIANPG